VSFQLGGQTFSPREYYRDDTQALAVLRSSRRNAVLVTGLRRIGKSWFLRRLAQILEEGKTRHFMADGARQERPLEVGLPARVRFFAGNDEASRDELKALLARPEPDTLVAVDEFEEIVADGSLVEPILRYRGPLVVAAAPILLEQVREIAGIFAFVTEHCEHKRLRPLSDHERRALVRQTFEADATLGVARPYQALALRREWGGHPMVLQQICIAIREERVTTVQELHDRAYAVLNGHSYGVSLVDRGLTRPQRALLIQVAAGVALAEDDVVTQLHDHGAIVRGEGGQWEIENRVLARYLQAATSRSAAPPVIALAPAPAPVVEPSVPVRVFSWIHVSDLHFGAGNRERHFDRKRVTQAILRDLRGIHDRTAQPPDRIFVTGDIAFSGRDEEYDEAKAWFDDVSRASGVPLCNVRLVPGNHDVDRGVARVPLTRAVHRAVRKGLIDLDELLGDTDGRSVLRSKLSRYRSFVDTNFFGHPDPLDDNGIDWVEQIPALPGTRGSLRIAGLSTVWISDEEDGGPRDKPFVPNMALALGPLTDTLGETQEGDLLLVLTHHPPHWLDEASAGRLSRALVRPAHIHLCGHVHRAAAGTEKRFGRAGESVRYVAGAAHGDKGEEYGYAWGALRHDPVKGQWHAGWAPRTYVPDLDQMRADSTPHDLDVDGFAWKDITCPWPAPESTGSKL
jgi:Calcineurin-like phosphoesterase